MKKKKPAPKKKAESVLFAKIPTDLYQLLREEAEREGRSIAKQISRILAERYASGAAPP